VLVVLLGHRARVATRKAEGTSPDAGQADEQAEQGYQQAYEHTDEQQRA